MMRADDGGASNTITKRSLLLRDSFLFKFKGMILYDGVILFISVFRLFISLVSSVY